MENEFGDDWVDDADGDNWLEEEEDESTEFAAVVSVLFSAILCLR